ncbi:MAG TPA: histidine--tRNA ligase [Candidatus Saccharimonadales bacterium]|nr:histidine--tRNA ligase [Candidatus Saccharimonadales bacterium]
MNIQTLKGFRDFLPKEARKREYVKSTLKKVFESYGFEPLETPILEYEEILTGKYGEEGDKLLYRFVDNGGRNVAMRYDQTVPLSRVVAQYQNELPTPFKRYQMQNVYRADNTQKGRYREFMQCDIDTVGVNTALSDAEIVAVVLAGYKALGFTNIKVLVNDRNVFEGMTPQIIGTIDKLKKIGEDGVIEELVARGSCKNAVEATNLLQSIIDAKMPERLQEIFAQLRILGIENDVVFSPTLARGLDYYTGLILEVESPDYPVGSLGGGGRYDNLIGMFAGKQIPAVGFAFGFDRTVEAMDTLNLFPKELERAAVQVLITIFDGGLEQKSIEASSYLRANNIATELFLGEIRDKNPLEKQLKYADQKGIPYAVIIGPEESEKNLVTLKNLATREQQQLDLDELLKKLQ